MERSLTIFASSVTILWTGSPRSGTNPLLGVVIDTELLHEVLWRAHLPDHPTLTQCAEMYVYNEQQFQSYPLLRVFSELILLAYLRSIHVAQEALCRSSLVTRQREHIDHAFRHQWHVADHVNLNALTHPERVLHELLTTYLYMCWNLTIVNYDEESPPLYPLLPKKKPEGEQ
eukprot:1721977-Amphidinium_carterae.1